MNIVFTRPSAQKLHQLLNDNPVKFERYLARFPDLAEQFETANPLNHLTDFAHRVLDNAFAVPNDLAARLRKNLFEAATETSAFAVGLDLFGVGVATVATLIDDAPIAEPTVAAD